MKKLFTAIRASDFEMVRLIIEKKPELVNCVAKQPPKKDDGQSPLQVALKTGNTAIANYLLDMGADVNFIEDESCCNAWRTPVIHDAINCAVMSCRWNTNDENMGFKVFSTKEKANRFALQAKQILPSYNYVEHREGKDRIFTEELHEDLRSVLQALKDAGADDSYIAPNLGYSVRKFCSEGSISILFDEVFGCDTETETI